MNERIRELAEQANKYSLSNVNRDSEFFHSIAMKKFAQLIVAECAMIVEGFEITQEVALDEYVDYEASDVLKKHFGVK